MARAPNPSKKAGLGVESGRIARLKTKAETRAAIAQKAFGYICISTEEQAEHSLGLDTQNWAVRAPSPDPEAMPCSTSSRIRDL